MHASEEATKPANGFSLRTLMVGMVVIALVYAGLTGFLILRAEQTILRQETKLASQTVIIDRIITDSVIPTEPEPEDIIAETEPEIPAEEDTVEQETTHQEPTSEAEIQTEDEVATEEFDAATDGPASLARAPINGLFEDTIKGRLPIIRSNDKMRPFDAYRRPAPTTANKNQIALVFVDVGLSEAMSTTIISDLPPSVAVAINPYATAPDLWASEARRAGHEPWLVLPMESALYPLDDSGPQTLLIRAVEQQNLNKLHWTLSRAQGYAGVISGYQPAFMKSTTDVRPVLGDIYGRGLGFVDGDTNPSSTPMSMASGYKAPYGHANIWIGKPESSTEAVSAGLRQLEILAENSQRAIGFVPVNPLTIELVKNWAETLPNKKITLVPLSTVTQN